MKRNIFLSAAIALSALMFYSCSKDHDTPDKPDTSSVTPEAKSKYVIVAIAGGSSKATYMVTADSVTGGSLSFIGNGTETDAITFLNLQNTLFGVEFGFTGQGPVTPYTLDSSGSTITAGTKINAVTAFSWATLGDSTMLLCYPGLTKAAPVSTFTMISAINPRIIGSASINGVTLAGNGEVANFSSYTKIGSKVYAPYYCTPAIGSKTQFPDSVWVAIFDYPAMTLNKVIRGNQSSYIGDFGHEGMFAVENGDLYGFSNALPSSKKSGAIRIKNGRDEIDNSYFFDVQTTTGGYKIIKTQYIGNNKFLAELTDEVGVTKTNVNLYTGKVNMYILDVAAQTATKVTGLSSFKMPSLDLLSVYVEADKVTVHAIFKQDDDDNLYVYNINANTATAHKGLQLEGASVAYAIDKLNY